MFFNHIKIAWRSILKNKLFSFINVLGLSIGICSAMVIGAIVYFDFSFDTFHKDKDKIYRVSTVFESNGNQYSNRGVAVPLMRTFQQGMPGVELAAPFMSTNFFKVENKSQDLTFKNVENSILADNAYFELFEYEWLAGDNKSALSNPAQVVLSENKAQKYFPHTPIADVVGKTLIYNDSISVKVSGVVADFKQNSDFKFTEFMSLSSAKMLGAKDIVTNNQWNGTSSGDQLFFKIKDEASIALVESRLKELAAEHKNKAEWAINDKRVFVLQPLTNLHFGGEYGEYPFNNSDHVASIKVLKSLGFVALFLLLLGCANFINLNSAQALTRAKEIGIRKTLGSSKKQVIRQFLFETMILTCIAAILSLVLAPLLLNQFVDFLPSDINLSILYSLKGALGILALIVLVSFLSGFYPAFVLSGFRPVSVLKGQFSKGDKGVRLRKTLTVFQFVVAQVFVIATLLVTKQLHYVMNKDMGLKTNATAYINTPWNNNSEVKKERLFNAVKDIQELSNVSWGGNPPASNNYSSSVLTYFKKDAEMHQETQLLWGDVNYLNTYKIPIISGRQMLNDSVKEYIVNESFAKAIGFQNTSDVIGTFVKQDTVKIPVVGLMRDFHQHSLRSDIGPMAITGDWADDDYSMFSSIHFDLGENSDNWTNSVKQIEEAWASVYPDEEVQVQFMDEIVEGFYRTERSTVQLLTWATGLSILISCMGLLGLVVYTTERRVKEIGVRKVLGANLAQLNMELSKEFLILIGIAFVISVPISWYLIQEWIQSFAFKTNLSWWVFLTSGIGMVLVALVVIGTRTYRAANINPVESLRTE
ncbi:ABC transporter permease [Flagellimonas zhangzhouensis]|uniref:ABC-type antimicrobial peptide transport system, permease component n=1 Tax=Flagellimonas zhangzhouensis TaxID=1073328 RepID=A0A1H2UWY7_9FLAO|nr:FtsX-like permease family protein [Allomuricauda zhangzhouensis]SDQ12872.1 FtsX-like permease family protein [Allomuricauda zhangzhouensis]SDW60583.1 ABC-type antimicrobial peptide transport system, permease component [Allomuricauda zhangzhouensis]